MKKQTPDLAPTSARGATGTHLISSHARQRMCARRVSEAAVASVITFGRSIHGRGALIYVIGRKEIQRYRREGIDLRTFEGIHVVCSPNGVVMTTYRNRELSGVRKLG